MDPVDGSNKLFRNVGNSQFIWSRIPKTHESYSTPLCEPPYLARNYKFLISQTPCFRNSYFFPCNYRNINLLLSRLINSDNTVSTVRSESRCALRLRYVDLVVSIEVPLKCNTGKVCNCLIQFLLTMVHEKRIFGKSLCT
jgi:hypothetical protein